MSGPLDAKALDVEFVSRQKKRPLRKRIKQAAWRVCSYAAAVLYILPSLVLYATRLRFVVISNPNRIGHLAAELDCFLKEMPLGDRPRVKAVLIASHIRIANPCLLDYWAERVRVVRNQFAGAALIPFLHFPYLRIDLIETVAVVNQSAAYPSVLARWGSRPPLLKLSDSHRDRGEACLEVLGVPPGAWFVCVHSREGGYSPKDEYMHAHRNSDINAYRLAMAAIVERGGWCLRMGDGTMKPLEPMPGVIDYASSSKKSDWMDIFLCARSRFFLGCASGLGMVSTTFGVPSALANLTPLSGAYPCGAFDLGVPMTLRMRSGRILPFTEAFGSPVADFRYAELFEANGFTNIANDPEEIRDLVVEMMDRLADSATYTEEDNRLQNSFRQLLRPGHYCFGAASRIGRDFLRQHTDLI